jgi:hypothetical protein
MFILQKLRNTFVMEQVQRWVRLTREMLQSDEKLFVHFTAYYLLPPMNKHVDKLYLLPPRMYNEDYMEETREKFRQMFLTHPEQYDLLQATRHELSSFQVSHSNFAKFFSQDIITMLCQLAGELCDDYVLK